MNTSVGIQVAYELRKSELGICVIAKSNIIKGTLVWKFVRGLNMRSFKGLNAVRQYLSTLTSAEEQKEWLGHTFYCGGMLNDALDDRRFLATEKAQKLRSVWAQE